MKNDIKNIKLPLPFRMGSVNCYLVETETGFILIDSGGTNNRELLVEELENAGCKPGRLNLILLTHGDFDHSGNAGYLRKVFGGKIAMHPGDAGMVTWGDMFSGRKRPNLIIRTLVPLFTRFGKSERFSADILVEDGFNLGGFGMDATIVSIPGHSKGSIGIVTSTLELFCGDLMENTEKPVLNSLMDDLAAASESVQKLEALSITTVYPGHGAPFAMSQFLEANTEAQIIIKPN